MKVGKIIAIVIAAIVVVAVYLIDRTPPKDVAVEATPQEETSPKPTSDLDKKVDEAVAIIESGSQPPMVAIQMLREVVAADSNHIKANYWLGEFSMMSGQIDKAIPRYAKILRLQPDNVDVCIKLARAYDANGQTQMGVSVLNEYKETHTDQNVIAQIEPVLNELSVKL